MKKSNQKSINKSGKKGFYRKRVKYYLYFMNLFQNDLRFLPLENGHEALPSWDM